MPNCVKTAETDGTTRTYEFAKGPDVVQQSSVACVFELQKLDGRRETILTVGYLEGDFTCRFKLRPGPNRAGPSSPLELLCQRRDLGLPDSLRLDFAQKSGPTVAPE